MTTSIGTLNGSGLSASTAQATPAPLATAASAPTSASIIAQTETISISPHVVIDPVAGFITQYLSSNGKVQIQFPSTTVVAYLKAGLTSQGLSRHPAANETTQASTVA